MKIRNKEELRMAKAQLKAKLELNEERIQMEIEHLKDHYSRPETYLPAKSSTSEDSSILTTTIKTLVSNIVLDKLVGSKSTFINRLGKILVHYLLK
ncbi:MAG: hypothetical protein CMP59_02890 [Flavobacteriales bacterium]|nr:hypothetical protein [Flavobacteriales bacterium]|tara:strand:+ start:1552 stop:1839 length:288 start_codon:yes stop_codon:yes gene_type:complete